LSQILQLYPEAGQAQALLGTYLAHRLHKLGSEMRPCVYANFVSSLDGRIALSNAEDGGSYLPTRLTSVSDWRLFRELQAQADCLITHSGYLRSLAAGKLDDILQVGVRDEDADLGRWRLENGLPVQPAVVIASASLEFPMPSSIKMHKQKVYIATGEKSDPIKIRRWRDSGCEVIIAGKKQFAEGAPLVSALAVLGYKSLYLIAGPQMLETMLRDCQLTRLYLTITHQIFGGKKFCSIFSGPELQSGGNLHMKSLYYDPHLPSGAGQWFAQFEPRP